MPHLIRTIMIPTFTGAFQSYYNSFFFNILYNTRVVHRAVSSLQAGCRDSTFLGNGSDLLLELDISFA